MSNTSFLPDDYLAQKAERRTNLISLTLFGVVMIAVVGAFFVTNRQARMVRTRQETINLQYQQAGMKIQELTQLEKQKDEMLHKAELAAALVERVPRSILLAELINRMPDRLGLLEFEMKSEKAKAPAAAAVQKDAKGRLATKPKTKEEAQETVQKIEATKYEVSISMVGVAPTDLEVSRYMTELNSYPLLQGVMLEYSEQKELNGTMMRQFKIKLGLDPEADVRRVDPVRRIRNPMNDDVQFNPPITINSASASGTQDSGD